MSTEIVAHIMGGILLAWIGYRVGFGFGYDRGWSDQFRQPHERLRKRE